MELRWFRAFVVLLAALIVMISGLVNKWPINLLLLRLLMVIIIFIIISSLGVRIIQRTMESGGNEKKNSAEQQEVKE